MIRRLRLKFICVNMLIVTVMMGVIFGLVYHFTQTGLETQSVSMLQSIAAEPFRPNRPGKPPEGVQLPFFMLELDEDGSLTAAGSGYYDLTDEEFLNTLVSAADESDAPHRCAAGIRPAVLPQRHPLWGAHRLCRYVQ